MSGYELLAELDRQLKDCLYISNECLPDGFRDERTDGVSLSTLERKCDERDKESEHMYTFKSVHRYRGSGEQMSPPFRGGRGPPRTPHRRGRVCSPIWVVYRRVLPEPSR